ncbi:hypothetical protein NL108_014564 [Boleophthalmus pectinirostris]|uniref:tripartite motif-containing protein 16-like n=1 Tax=Boleophthalmus pectinirostris TaxID=150288 RepID=UPI000A1C6BC9|nr:tripartite motif-containing protein 16-like [Boleophthalmus pectinirostris]KAJ0059872.1 hypothetical protein NL108_014564 [Boleophthalmus pectinirostris]
MAESKLQLDLDAFSCPICLELLNNPVTIPCGHSYCMRCIENHWNREENFELYSCPQCRQSFAPRPALVKNTMLDVLVEQLQKSGYQSASTDHCPAEKTDITCDICIGNKLKATKSCLQCVASYCEVHLQPHYQSDALRKHQLMTPTRNIQENICTKHNEVKRMFCSTDRELICVACCMEKQHIGHCVVTAAEERDKKQLEVEARHHQVVQKILNKETDLESVKKEELDLKCNAEEAVEITVESFTGLIHLIQKKMYDIEQQLWKWQKAEEEKIQQRLENLEFELKELKMTQAELNSLVQTPDHNFFLHKYTMLSSEIQTKDDIQNTEMSTENTVTFLDRVSISVADLTDNLKLSLTEELAKILPETQKMPTQPDPKTREDFLKYSCQITMDSYTAHSQIKLSDGDRRATLMEEDQKYPKNPNRFSYYWQVLSREDLISRHYWELEWRGSMVDIGFAYKSLKRKGSSNECVFGLNDKSWALCIDKTGCLFKFNKVQSQVSGPIPAKIGVYLDHDAGVVCFYSISDTMTLLHRVQTTFTQPLYVGLRFYWGLYFTGDTVQFLTLE